MSLLLEEHTYVLRKCFFAVQNEVGLGRSEEAYHQACKFWLAENQIPVVSKPPHRLFVAGREAHVLTPDFVGWSVMTIEIKAVPRRLNSTEWVQIRDYMKCRGDSLGLLVSFGLDRVHVERVVQTPCETTLVEEFSHWQGAMTSEPRNLGAAIRDALRNVYSEHSTGYGREVISRLVRCALTAQGLHVAPNPVVSSYYGGVAIDASPLDCLIVNNRYVLVLTSLFDSNEFNVSRGLSFMKSLQLEWGVAVNFGKRQAEFRGLRHRSGKSSPRATRIGPGA